MLGRLRRLFQFRNSSPPQPAIESIDLPVVSRHSPTEIAILRCSDVIFFETNAESAREQLESRLEKEGAKEIAVVRRLPDAEVAGYYDELLPLLCIDFPTKNNPYSEITNNIREQGVMIRMNACGGNKYLLELFPARKRTGSLRSTSVAQQCLESTTSVVCSWKLQSITLEAYEEGRASDKQDKTLVPLLQTRNFLCLKDLASLAVLINLARENVDGLLGIIPSTLVAYLKGQ